MLNDYQKHKLKYYGKNLSIVALVLSFPSVAMAANDPSVGAVDVSKAVKSLESIKGPIGSIGSAYVSVKVVRRAWKMVAGFI